MTTRTEPHPSNDEAEAIRPLLVNAPQAAKILSIGRTALYQLIWDGELTPIHIGRSVRFSVDQLETFVQGRLNSEIPHPPQPAS